MQGIAATKGTPQAKRGDCILSEDSLAENFVFLQSGKVSAYLLTEGDTPYYLYSLQAPAVLAMDPLLLSSRYSARWLAEQAVALSVHNGEAAYLRHIFKNKPAFALLAARSLFLELNALAVKLQKALQQHRFLARGFSSVALSLARALPQQFSEQTPKPESDILSNRVQLLTATYLKNNGNIPLQIDTSFLARNHLQNCEIETEYDFSLSPEDFLFLKHLFALKPKIQNAIVKSDESFFPTVMKKMAVLMQECRKQLVMVVGKIETYRKLLFEGDLCAEQKLLLGAQAAAASGESDASLASLYSLFAYFVSFAHNAAEQFSTLWKLHSHNGSDIGENAAPLMAALKQKLAQVKEVIEEPEESSEDIDERLLANTSLDSKDDEDDDDERTSTMALGESFVPTVEVSAAFRSKILEETKNIAAKIMAYAEIPKEEIAGYEDNLQKFLSLEDPFSSESGERKIRRTMNIFYWQVYEKAAIKYLKKRDALPKYLCMFFNYGLFDDRLLDPEHITFLYTQDDLKPDPYAERPDWNNVYTIFEWLTLIYDKKIPTSLNELGLTYFEILRQENRDKKWKRESDLPPELDTGEARLKYEIKNMVESTTKLCSGSIMTHIAPLTRYSINRPLERAFVNKERMEKMLQNLLEIDFGVYHREILYSNEKAGINREFIQKQIMPNIILMPTAGHNFQFWQEREGRDRLSPGRIMCPVIATEDIFQMLLGVSGAYRWEMTKTTMGVDWNNIAQSSLTADYTDYVQFFRKNKDLSVEVKEKLNAEFKRFRDDRSRFIHNYRTWVLFESEGRQKLNKVARKILAKHIPFTKTIREELLRLPMFIDPVQKSINLRKKKARDLEPRYKKYRNNNNGVLPKDLEENYKFFNMENY